MLKEFRDFIMRGNVMDLAVGVIIGSAFTAIVNSLVTNLINPLIGIFLGKIDLSNLVLKVGEATFKYGEFLNSVINFLIIAFVVFLMMKAINTAMAKAAALVAEQEAEDEKDPEPTSEDYLKQIVELLEKK